MSRRLVCALAVLLSAAMIATTAAEEASDRAVRILEGEGEIETENRPVTVPPVTEIPDLSSVRIENPAGLAIEILPGAELSVGTKVRFRIQSKRQGYLMLVSVDASGRLIQIYPNPRSLWSMGANPNMNQVRPGRPVTIPDEQNPFAAFEFVTAPPAGVAMVVAIMSDRPVQIVDLPDIPAEFAGRAEALKFLSEATRSLRIAQGNDQLQAPEWSFDATFYNVK